MEDAALALAQELRKLCQTDMVGPYTLLAPRRSNGVVTVRVKDKRRAKMLTITVTEDEE